MLEFPLHESFFPQIVLNADEVKYYKRLGKERLTQLMRIAEDADYAYKWTDMRTKYGTPVQKTQFLDFRPATKATYASMLIKSSVLISDTCPEELLTALAKAKTKEYRKTMSYLHGSSFIDGRTLFKFPSSVAATRPEYSYRAIKWCGRRGKGRDENKSLDFSFLEYAGKKRASAGSNVVGFVVQESIEREREVPMLENFGIVRGYLSRSGIIILKTHQANVYRVTSICQIDGDVEPVVRSVLEDIMQETVGAITRLRGLIDRQRASSMKFLEQWEWVANSDRKACAVCTKGFFFHRKHHCRSCGEVVCSSCAPLRELDDQEIKELRICSTCMSKAGLSSKPESSSDRHADTITSNEDSETFVAGLHSPRKESQDEMMFQMRENKDRLRRPSDAAKLLLDNSNRSTPKSKRRLSTFLKNPRETVATLTNLVDQIRTARDTINITISEAGDSRLSFGEDDAYNDLYDRVTKLRETVEYSVDHNEQGPHTPGRTSPAPGVTPSVDSDEEPMMESELVSRRYPLPVEQFQSIARLTFEAARATRDAGEKVLSSCASEMDASDEGEEVYDVLPSPSQDSHTTGFSGSDASKDPYSSSNYDRIMASYNTNRDSRGTFYDDGYSTATSHRSNGKRSTRITTLEKKIEALQRDLEDAHRKLSFFELEEPEPELAGLSVLHEEPYYDQERGFRSSGGPKRRPSDFGSRSAREAPHQYERVGRMRPKSDSLLKANVPPRLSLDTSAMQRRGSEFGQRPSMPAGIASSGRASSGGRALSTADMVSELYGVMTSSEMNKPTTLPPRKRSVKNIPSPPPKHPSSGSSPKVSRTRAPPPPPPVFKKTMYVDDDGHLLPGTPSSTSSPRTGNGFDKTASSSASYEQMLEESHSSSSGILSKSRGSHTDSGLDSSRYNKLLAANAVNPASDDSSSEDLESSFSAPSAASSSNNSHDKNATHANEDKFFGKIDESDGAFFGRRQVVRSPATEERTRRASALDRVSSDRSFFGSQNPRATRPMSNMDQRTRRASALDESDRPFMGGGHSVLTARPPLDQPARRGSALVIPRHTNAPRTASRDESDDLRNMMEGLIRPRSNSVPFRMTAPQDNVGYGQERPAWGDDASHATSRQLDSAIAEVRNCLSALHRECPSQWERHRKLQSVSKILQSLQRDGARSKFRTLNHEDIRYEKVLHETPSIIKLLKLAGYVSFPHKLTMRNVDQEYIHAILDEIDGEIKDMQASQDYL